MDQSDTIVHADTISTGELVRRLGVSIPSHKIAELGVLPLMRTSNAIYWLERDVPLIAMAIAKMLVERAIELQRGIDNANI